MFTRRQRHLVVYLELHRASEGTFSRWSRVVGYSPFSLCVIHKEGLCPSNGDINMMMMICLVRYSGLNIRILTISSFLPLMSKKASNQTALDLLPVPSAIFLLVKSFL
jgi:hypothetical protein